MTSTRPFQVGDRVRIVGWDTYGPHEGTITEILPARMRTDGFLAGVPRSALIVTDCAFTLDSGTPALACAALNEDLTGAGWYGGQIELIDAADDAGRVQDVAEAERLAYAVEDEWAPVVPDPYSVEYARALTGPEPEGEAYGMGCTSTRSGFQCNLPVHDGLHVALETGNFWTDHGALIERPVWDDERHIWVSEHTPELPEDGCIER